MGTKFPPTPTIPTAPTTIPVMFPPTPISTTVPTSTLSVESPIQQNENGSTLLTPSSTTGPSSSAMTLGSSTSGPSTFSLSPPSIAGVMMSSTVAQGIFGVGANFDPLIIAGLVLAGIICLVLLGALIYCCCNYCGAPTRHPIIIHRNQSFQTIRQERQPTRPIYLTASLAPEYSSSADDPAASVFLQQPLRVTVGAYAAGGNGGSSIVGSYPRRMHQQMIQPDVIVTRAPSVHTMARKQYLYPADAVGFGNDMTYNTIRPTIISRSTPVITTLGDGYAIGHSLRSTGNRYGGRNLLLYEDEPSHQIITLY